MDLQLDEDWMPLESNPEAINEYVLKLGLNTESYGFCDLYDSDEDFLKMMSLSTKAALMIFPIDGGVQKQADKELEQIEEHGQIVSDNVYFMKQDAENACGTIAIMHAALNIVQEDPNIILPDSILAKFRESSLTMTPDERANQFKKSKQIQKEHVDAVESGETKVESKSKTFHHFICLVPNDGHLYELDGCKPFPINHGSTSQETLLPDIYKVFQKFLSVSKDQYSFSILLLQKND